MNIAFSLKNKLKIALLLFLIATCSILISILEEKNIAKIDDAFISMYNDRLVPATDLFLVSEYLIQKDMLWHEFTTSAGSETSKNEILTLLLDYNKKVDSVIKRYESTKLVPNEVYHLAAFKQALADRAKQVDKLLELYRINENAAENAYKDQTGAPINQTWPSLSKLIKIQSEVGDELLNDFKVAIRGTKLYSTIQIALAICIGLLIVGIVGASNIVDIKNDKFKLN